MKIDKFGYVKIISKTKALQSKRLSDKLVKKNTAYNIRTLTKI